MVRKPPAITKASTEAPGARRSKSTSAAPRRSRRIPGATKILLAVAAGGRCEFAGCNEYLFTHPLTLRGGNYSEQAHIYPFSGAGPRSGNGPQPSDLHSVGNLMLLCQPCHKLVDDRPDLYPRALLERYKAEHEARIRHVTGLGPDLRTTVVQLRAKIAGQAVDIPATEIYEAVAPRYPVDERGHVIDLAQLDDRLGDSYWATAAQKISRDVARIYDPGMSVESTRHISLFALAPIPLLVHLGRHLSNKVDVDFFQRHRTGSPWVWKTDGEPAHFAWRLLRPGRNETRVALLIGVSGVIRREQLPPEIDDQFWLYELTASGRAPGLDLIRQRHDLHRFRIAYRGLLGHLRATHGPTEVHLFPAVPAPVAVACGHDLLPKVDPALLVYDNDKDRGGFFLRVKVNTHD